MLDKQNMTMSKGKVVAAGFPRLENNPITAKAEMVVDITIDDGSGKTGSYVIPEGLSVTYAGNIILSTDKAGLAVEVDAIKSNAEQILASVDRQKDILEKSTSLLSELNPAFREKVENDKRFDVLENSVNELKELIQRLATR